jgi:hypothetical protein
MFVLQRRGFAMFASRLRVWSSVAVLVAVVALRPGPASGEVTVSAVTDAERPAATIPSAEEVTILTYDVGDLILDVPDYPYPGSANASSLFGASRTGGVPGASAGGMGGMGMGGMGGGMGGGFMSVRDDVNSSAGGLSPSNAPGSSPHSTKITMEDLKQVLITVVAPDTWSENGGEDGELQHLGTSLVIRQTAAVHEQIGELLDQLRQGSGKQRTVAIDARWLLLDSDELEQLMPTDESGESQVDREVLGEFTRRPSSIRGKTNCFTGQLVYLVSGTRRNVVTSFVPVVGSVGRPQEMRYAALPGGAHVVPTQMFQSSRAVGYQPVIATPNLGVLLQIRPTLIPGDSRAIVDLRSTLTVLGDPSSEAAAPVQSGQDMLVPTVDRVAIETQELATTFSVPLGEPVLSGGLTYIGPSAGTSGQRGEAAAGESVTATETPQLYLVLELR